MLQASSIRGYNRGMLPPSRITRLVLLMLMACGGSVSEGTPDAARGLDAGAKDAGGGSAREAAPAGPAYLACMSDAGLLNPSLAHCETAADCTV